MTDPITVLREAIGTLAGMNLYDQTGPAALTQVENLVRAAKFAAPCVDRNATLAAQTLADALAPFKDTP